MENLENIPTTESQLIINNDAKSYLLETAKWSKFLAIAGFVGMGILVLLGIFVMVGLSAFSSISNVGFPMGALGFVYILIALIYYFPLSYLYKFSVNLAKGLKSNEQQSVDHGFENLKSLFKFMGIFTLVVLSIYALALLIMIPVAIFSGIK